MVKYIIVVPHSKWNRCRDDFLINYSQYCEPIVTDRDHVYCHVNNMDQVAKFCSDWLLSYRSINK